MDSVPGLANVIVALKALLVHYHGVVQFVFLKQNELAVAGRLLPLFLLRRRLGFLPPRRDRFVEHLLRLKTWVAQVLNLGLV